MSLSTVHLIDELMMNCDALRDLVWFVQFKKCEKHPWRNVTFTCNFTKSNTPSWVFLRFANCTNGAKSRKASQLFLQNSWGFFKLNIQPYFQARPLLDILAITNFWHALSRIRACAELSEGFLGRSCEAVITTIPWTPKIAGFSDINHKIGSALKSVHFIKYGCFLNAYKEHPNICKNRVYVTLMFMHMESFKIPVKLFLQFIVDSW